MPWICEECGSTQVEGTAWVDLNTWTLVNNDPPLDLYWCHDCNEETHAVWKEDAHDEGETE